MPPQDIEAQFKFLLCCVKHSSAGKVNFDAVASELDIVSKAAAAKRYERLLKAHGITIATPRKGAQGNNDGGEGDTPASRKRKRATAAKRENGANNNDSDEDGTPVKKERRAAVKKERGVKKEESPDDDDDDKVKTEQVEDPEETEALPDLRHKIRTIALVPPSTFPMASQHSPCRIWKAHDLAYAALWQWAKRCDPGLFEVLPRRGPSFIRATYGELSWATSNFERGREIEAHLRWLVDLRNYVAHPCALALHGEPRGYDSYLRVAESCASDSETSRGFE
ncbi:hypothetical protein C8A03DRAFT_30442, partial [Achaetomium macrosporum]